MAHPVGLEAYFYSGVADDDFEEFTADFSASAAVAYVNPSPSPESPAVKGVSNSVSELSWTKISSFSHFRKIRRSSMHLQSTL